MKMQRVCRLACSHFKLCQCLSEGVADRKGAPPPTPSRLLNFSGPVAEGGREATHLTSPFLSTEKANKCRFCTKQPGTRHVIKVFNAEADKSSRYEGKKRPQLQNQVAQDTVCYALSTITPVIIKHPWKKRPFATYYDAKIEPCSEAAELH